MGGDDLASDDEYLADSGLAYASSSDGEDDGAQASTKPAPNAKRKGTTTTTTSTGDDDPRGSEQLLPPPRKNRKRNAAPTSSHDILLLAGRGIAMDGPDAQAMFLGTLYSHSIKLSGGGVGAAATASASGGSGENGPEEEAGDGGRRKSSNDDDDDDDDDDASSSSFSFLPHLHVASPDGGGATGDAKARQQCRHSDLGAFLKSGGLLPSNKRLKNWKHPRSPMVLVVTLSARRSVELMRQLSSLKLPVAKLFAKHMSVEDQVGLLRGYGGGKSTSSSSSGKVGGGGVGGKKRGGGGGKYYSLAVGTPGRLLKLLRHSGRDDDGGGGEGADAVGMGALRLNHTEVVIIDCHEDSKGWNVCTLNDTSKELMEFVKQGVIPQLDKRKGKIKLAMF